MTPIQIADSLPNVPGYYSSERRPSPVARPRREGLAQELRMVSRSRWSCFVATHFFHVFEKLISQHHAQADWGSICQYQVQRSSGGSWSVYVLARRKKLANLRSEARVSSYGNSERLCQLEKGFLCQIRVNFDLEDLGLNSGITHDIEDQSSLDIATHPISRWQDKCRQLADLIPMFLTNPSSTKDSSACQVSW